MSRILSERDFKILKKLAPEYEGEFCPGSGHEFHSVLPPVSNHFASDERDFAERVGRLSGEDWEYLAGMILSGEESLGCLPEEDLGCILDHIRNALSEETAQKIRTLYHLTVCGIV